ncbi:hypothetical protein [Rhodoblastus sp.]|uniref:hypothetical protein n=1 Tax=Rhodoblastus sp. TaxID=1962975 RepID=UPI003F98A417
MDPEKPPVPEKPAKTAKPALSPEKQAQKRRLTEALRENLRRRKAQIRQRKIESGGETGS